MNEKASSEAARHDIWQLLVYVIPMTQGPLTVGKFLFDFLHEEGVGHAFGIPGDFALPTFRWLERSRIELITMTHEPSVGFAADGYARAHGLGVAVVTYCVGGLNMLNSVACAYAEKSPLVVISGGPSPNDREKDPLVHHKVRTFDTQRRIFEEVTCANTVLLDPERAAEEIVRVVREVRRQCRPGYIEIPFDVADTPISPPRLSPEPVPGSDAENLDAAIQDAVATINAAKRPVIVAGIELHRHKLTPLAERLSGEFNIPIAATLLSKSVVSEQSPLYVGVYSGGLSEPETQGLVEESDCLIMLGAFLTDVLMGMDNTARLSRRHTIVASTEKTLIGLRRYEQVEFGDFLRGLLEGGIEPRSGFTNPVPFREPLALPAAQVDEPVTAESFFQILEHEMPEDATLVCDVGDALFGVIGLRTREQKNFLSDAYYLSMGFAVPASIGAMAANPSSRTIVIAGDGAFQMTGIELSTVAKQGMTPIVCVLNNDGYGTQRHIIDGPFNDIHPWDYGKLTEVLSYGTPYRVTTKGELKAALEAAVAKDEMALIEVVVPRDDCSRPLKRLGESLARQRDSEKRAKAEVTAAT